MNAPEQRIDRTLIVHKPCQQVLFYYDKQPARGERVLAEHVTFRDGSKPVAGQRWCVTCEQCDRDRVIPLSECEPWGGYAGEGVTTDTLKQPTTGFPP
jgi:hypothetical protein